MWSSDCPVTASMRQNQYLLSNPTIRKHRGGFASWVLHTTNLHWPLPPPLRSASVVNIKNCPFTLVAPANRRADLGAIYGAPAL